MLHESSKMQSQGPAGTQRCLQSPRFPVGRRGIGERATPNLCCLACNTPMNIGLLLFTHSKFALPRAGGGAGMAGSPRRCSPDPQNAKCPRAWTAHQEPTPCELGGLGAPCAGGAGAPAATGTPGIAIWLRAGSSQTQRERKNESSPFSS